MTIESAATVKATEKKIAATKTGKASRGRRKSMKTSTAKKVTRADVVEPSKRAEWLNRHLTAMKRIGYVLDLLDELVNDKTGPSFISQDDRATLDSASCILHDALRHNAQLYSRLSQPNRVSLATLVDQASVRSSK